MNKCETCGLENTHHDCFYALAERLAKLEVLVVAYRRECMTPPTALASAEGRPVCEPWCGTEREDLGTLSYCTNECGRAGRPLKPAEPAKKRHSPSCATVKHYSVDVPCDCNGVPESNATYPRVDCRIMLGQSCHHRVCQEPSEPDKAPLSDDQEEYMRQSNRELRTELRLLKADHAALERLLAATERARDEWKRNFEAADKGRNKLNTIMAQQVAAERARCEEHGWRAESVKDLRRRIESGQTVKQYEQPDPALAGAPVPGGGK